MIKAIITTFDNLPNLQETIPILRSETLDEIIIVNNGSRDGTGKWLATQADLTIVNRENRGAGPGRNAGLDAAGEFDYVLMLDGGIRPLRGGIQAMLDYLEANPGVDVISPEVATCFTTDLATAWRRMTGPIDASTAFPQRCISSTAYALCRAKAWNGLRFSEVGPFAQPGWGVDDNEMACRWNDAGIVHHDFMFVGEQMRPQVYRRQGGSWGRLSKETGVWPNQYGSVYEQRCVLLRQTWPQYFDPPWHKSEVVVSCIILAWNEYPMFAWAVQRIHEDLKDVPHEIIVVDNGSTDETRWWLDTFALRWHHSDTTIDAKTGAIVRKAEHSELSKVWTGDVIRIDLPENMGAGYGFNAGFDKARGKYIFYLSGDILPVPGSVLALKEYLDAHDDADYVGLNAWTCQNETTDVEFHGFEPRGEDDPGEPRQGLGNYAYSYAMIRRKVLDAGVRMADSGPFAGPGCRYEEAEFANAMYSHGLRGWIFNKPTYFHDRRDFRRAGLDGDKEHRLEERRRWLSVRWPGIRFDCMHHSTVPERHIRRVAVVYKASPDRPGPGGHLLSALQTICVAEQFAPGNEPRGWDNYLYVDNGDFDYFACPEHCHPSTFWFIDMMTPQQAWRPSLEQCVERAKTFDTIYAAQPSAVAYFEEHDVEAGWLPLAANPDYHKPHKVTPVYDWIALWHHCGERIPYIQVLEGTNGFVGYKDGLEYSEWLCKSRCALSLSRSNELILRVFEIMATGVPLVTDRARSLDLLFVEGKHYLGFDSPEEMQMQICWVAAHPGQAANMARLARNEVLDKHTFYHRVLEMFGEWHDG